LDTWTAEFRSFCIIFYAVQPSDFHMLIKLLRFEFEFEASAWMILL